MPGHQGYEPNEIADKLAKEAAETAKQVHYPCDRKIILNMLKENILCNWQFRYDLNCFEHRLYGVCDKVGKWFNPNIPGIKKLFQLVSGHTELNSCVTRYNLNVPNDKCVCGLKESPEHYMFVCERYSLRRYELCQKLGLILGTNFQSLQQVGWKTLLGQNEEHTYQTRLLILEETVQFIKKTKRFNKDSIP